MAQTPQEAAAEFYVSARYEGDTGRTGGSEIYEALVRELELLGGTPFVARGHRLELLIVTIGETGDVSVVSVLDDQAGGEATGTVEVRSLGHLRDAVVRRQRRVVGRPARPFLVLLELEHPRLPGGSVVADSVYLEGAEVDVVDALACVLT